MIAGDTQPVETQPPAWAGRSRPPIIVNGLKVNGCEIGFHIKSANVTLQGLGVSGFMGAGIYGEAAVRLRVVGCHIFDNTEDHPMLPVYDETTTATTTTTTRAASTATTATGGRRRRQPRQQQQEQQQQRRRLQRNVPTSADVYSDDMSDEDAVDAELAWEEALREQPMREGGGVRSNRSRRRDNSNSNGGGAGGDSRVTVAPPGSTSDDGHTDDYTPPDIGLGYNDAGYGVGDDADNFTFNDDDDDAAATEQTLTTTAPLHDVSNGSSSVTTTTTTTTPGRNGVDDDQYGFGNLDDDYDDALHFMDDDWNHYPGWQCLLHGNIMNRRTRAGLVVDERSINATIGWAGPLESVQAGSPLFVNGSMAPTIVYDNAIGANGVVLSAPNGLVHNTWLGFRPDGTNGSNGLLFSQHGTSSHNHADMTPMSTANIMLFTTATNSQIGSDHPDGRVYVGNGRGCGIKVSAPDVTTESLNLHMSMVNLITP